MSYGDIIKLKIRYYINKTVELSEGFALIEHLPKSNVKNSLPIYILRDTTGNYTRYSHIPYKFDSMYVHEIEYNPNDDHLYIHADTARKEYVLKYDYKDTNKIFKKDEFEIIKEREKEVTSYEFKRFRKRTGVHD